MGKSILSNFNWDKKEIDRIKLESQSIGENIELKHIITSSSLLYNFKNIKLEVSNHFEYRIEDKQEVLYFPSSILELPREKQIFSEIKFLLRLSLGLFPEEHISRLDIYEDIVDKVLHFYTVVLVNSEFSFLLQLPDPMKPEPNYNKNIKDYNQWVKQHPNIIIQNIYEETKKANFKIGYYSYTHPNRGTIAFFITPKKLTQTYIAPKVVMQQSDEDIVDNIKNSKHNLTEKQKEIIFEDVSSDWVLYLRDWLETLETEIETSYIRPNRKLLYMGRILPSSHKREENLFKDINIYLDTSSSMELLHLNKILGELRFAVKYLRGKKKTVKTFSKEVKNSYILEEINENNLRIDLGGTTNIKAVVDDIFKTGKYGLNIIITDGKLDWADVKELKSTNIKTCFVIVGGNSDIEFNANTKYFRIYKGGS